MDFGYGIWVWNLGMEFRGGLYVSKVWSFSWFVWNFVSIDFRLSFVFFGVGGYGFFFVVFDFHTMTVWNFQFLTLFCNKGFFRIGFSGFFPGFFSWAPLALCFQFFGLSAQGIFRTRVWNSVPPRLHEKCLCKYFRIRQKKWLADTERISLYKKIMIFFSGSPRRPPP